MVEGPVPQIQGQIIDASVQQTTAESVEVETLIPQECIRQRTVEVVADVPVPRTQERINDMTKVIFQERISERIVEQIADVLLLETVDETVKANQPVPQDRSQEGVVVEFVDVCVPRLINEVTGVAKLIPQDRMQNRMLDAPVPQIQDEIVEVIRLSQQERISECIVVQTVDVSLPQIWEQSVEVAKVMPHERLQQCERGAECAHAICGAALGARGSGCREVPRRGRGERCEGGGQESFGASLRYCAKHLHGGQAQGQGLKLETRRSLRRMLSGWFDKNRLAEKDAFVSNERTGIRRQGGGGGHSHGDAKTGPPPFKACRCLVCSVLASKTEPCYPKRSLDVGRFERTWLHT